jgi:hypothetical protein
MALKYIQNFLFGNSKKTEEVNAYFQILEPKLVELHDFFGDYKIGCPTLPNLVLFLKKTLEKENETGELTQVLKTYEIEYDKYDKVRNELTEIKQLQVVLDKSENEFVFSDLNKLLMDGDRLLYKLIVSNFKIATLTLTAWMQELEKRKK